MLMLRFFDGITKLSIGKKERGGCQLISDCKVHFHGHKVQIVFNIIKLGENAQQSRPDLLPNS